MSRVANVGESVTSRQKKLLDQAHAREIFKHNADVVYQVDSIFKKFKGDSGDWFDKTGVFERLLYCPHQYTACIEVELKTTAALEKPAALEIDVPQLLNVLPSHMLSILLLYDPPPPHQGDVTPRHLSPLDTGCDSFLVHLLRCADLMNIVTFVLCYASETRNARLVGQDWPAVQARALKLQQGEQTPSPVLTAAIDAALAVLAKVLGPQRQQMEDALLSAADDVQQVDWAVQRMKMIVYLANSVDRLCLLQAVVRQATTIKQLQHSAVEQVAANLLFQQPAVAHFLTALMRYCSMMFRLLRERTLRTLSEDMAQNDRRRRATRDAALQLAVVHEVLERWIQSKPMGDILSRAGPDNITAEALHMVHAGMALLSPDSDSRNRRIYCKAFEQRPGEVQAECAVAVATSVLHGDIELLVARSYLVFGIITRRLTGKLAALGGQDLEGCQEASRTDTGAWVMPWMACAYHTLHSAHQVLARKWPANGADAGPQTKQCQEGQLSLNVLRAASAVLASNCHLLAAQPAGSPFAPATDKFKFLAVAVRALLIASSDQLASCWAVGPRAQALFTERESVQIAPLGSFSSESAGGSHFVCIDGIELQELLEREWKRQSAGAESAAAHGKRGRGSSKQGGSRRPSDDAMKALLQALEMNLQVWRIICGMLHLQMSAGASFADTALAGVIRHSIDKALEHRSIQEVYERVPDRITSNLAVIIETAGRTEAAIRAEQGQQSLDFSPDHVKRLFEDFFLNLREQFEAERR